MKPKYVLCLVLAACTPADRVIPVPPAAELALQAEGDSLKRLGDSASLTAAMSRLVAAESSATARSDTLMLGVHLAAQASLWSLKGDRDRALGSYRRAEQLFAAISHSNQSPTLAAMGRTYGRFGDADSAVFYLERALTTERARTEPSATFVDRVERERDSIVRVRSARSSDR